MNLLRTSLSRYLSRALSPRSLYFSVFFCFSKQTDASVPMMSCFRPQASMAEAWHSHAIHHCPLYTPQTTNSFSSTCMLQIFTRCTDLNQTLHAPRYDQYLRDFSIWFKSGRGIKRYHHPNRDLHHICSDRLGHPITLHGYSSPSIQ